MDPNYNEILTLAEAGRLIGRSPSTLRLAARQGKLIARRKGRDWLTDLDALGDYVARYVRGPISYGDPSGRCPKAACGVKMAPVPLPPGHGVGGSCRPARGPC